MKKSLIAFAVLSAFASAASAQSSVVLYGVIDTSTSYMSSQSATAGKRIAMDTNGLSSSRWGFKGSEDLGNGLKANFNLESSLSVDTGVAGNLFDRTATVGLEGAFGKVNAGRQTNLAYDTLSMVDPLSFANPGTNANVNLGSMNNATLYSAHGSSNGFSSAARENNAVKYTAPAMLGGIVFSGMYGFGEKTANTQAGSYMGASATYAASDISVVFSYNQLRDATGASTLRSYTGGAKFVVTPELTFKVSYAENEVNSTTRNVSVFGTGFDYAVSPTTTFTGAYYANRRSGDVEGKADTYQALMKYSFSKRTAAYASFSYVRAGTTAAKDTDLGLFLAAGNKTGTRTIVGINHAF
jgi:predicted porin